MKPKDHGYGITSFVRGSFVYIIIDGNVRYRYSMFVFGGMERAWDCIRREIKIRESKIKRKEKQMSKESFFLVVKTNPNTPGGGGTKYKTEEEALEAAKAYVTKDPRENYFVMKPCKLVEPAQAPCKVTDV